MKTRSIAITGATGGIGAALVTQWAKPGVTFFLAGRDVQRLNDISDYAEGQGADIHTCTTDVTDIAAFTEALLAFDAVHSVDLFVCGAGVKTGQTEGCESPEQLDRVLDVNLRASLHAVQSLLPKMIVRRRGQIALMSSMAAISPHADLLSYSATKAALRAYGTALRQAVRGTGVSVSVITPGYIDTPMTDRQLGPTPFKVSAERAAKVIDRGLARNRAYITFPLALTVLVRLKAMLPVAIKDLIDSGHRARIIPDSGEGE